MKRWSKHIIWTAWCIAGMMVQTSCSTIDDDLSDCDNEFELNYELRLVTNMTTELQTQLNTQADATIADALSRHLATVFTDYAHDVDLSFYDTGADDIRLKHESPMMDASQRSYTIYLPVQQYMHLAAANMRDNTIVSLTGDEHCHTSALKQQEPSDNNTLPSHTTGLFTARQPMDVIAGVDQTFNVKLYMANCASALVIDPRGHQAQDIKVYATGFATEFNINDSIYTYRDNSPLIQAEPVTAAADGAYSFCAVSFPSPEPATLAAATRVVIETTDPFTSGEAADKLWEFRVYVTNADGTVTESILNVRKPLRAGQLTIIKAYLAGDGSVRTDDQTIGVSVTLDWNDGGSHDVLT